MNRTSHSAVEFQGELHTRLPSALFIETSCYEQPEIGSLVGAAVQSRLLSLAHSGMDLRALDGFTLAKDCAGASAKLHRLPEGQEPLVLSDQPETEEMARTVPVWREGQVRFHIVLRAGLGLALLGTDETLQSFSDACIAHEAAHVEHEGHLYRTFPEIYGKPVPCGNRSRRIFIRALDVWSEYAACRSSAMFRPEAVEEFQEVFSRALRYHASLFQENDLDERKKSSDQRGPEMERISADMCVCAAYFLGHIDGLGLDQRQHMEHAFALLSPYPPISEALCEIGQALDELWASEFDWGSIEAFAHLYDSVCRVIWLKTE